MRQTSKDIFIIQEPHFFDSRYMHSKYEPQARIDEYIVVPRFLMRVTITGTLLAEIGDIRAYERTLAKQVLESVARRNRRRRVNVELRDFRDGSIEFLAGIGFGALFYSAFSLIKDYPNFKKGCKELSDDLKKISKHVTERFIK